ncbi:MAG: 5-deoxy-glucuronate isomerase [Actinomycetaceae bacterium]|nr:5-deoxy-glucuronate isomerase [Actinomycetaceae bacterium]MDU0970505.1 5-deoxy-glucuronate isomerase [Actinomycetaceae bacterium]
MSDNDTYLIKAGTTAHGPYETDVDVERAGWAFSGIRVLALGAGESETIDTGEDELLVLPLSGGCTVEAEGATYDIAGRTDQWSEVTDYLYLPRETTATITSAQGGRFALPSSRCTKRLEVTYCPIEKVNTSLRGAGPCSRQVNNYALGNELKTDHLLVTEVLTPGGNWSSYPPHKHDEHNEVERELEEIYYFEVRKAPDGTDGFALQRVYPSPGHPIDVCCEIRDRDVVVMPYGYHGPSAAAPGYDLYYLNVMAGPAEDATWLMTDDPDHAWVRGTWENQDVDPRLPMTKPVN